MGLQLEIEEKNSGVVACYHTVSCNKAKNMTEIVIQSYVSKAKKESGASYIEKKIFTVPTSSSLYEKYLSEDIVEASGKTDTRQAYALIKSLDGAQREADDFYENVVGEDGVESRVQRSDLDDRDLLFYRLHGVDFTAAIDV